MVSEIFREVDFWRALACRRIMRRSFLSVEVAPLGVLHGDSIC